MLAEFGLKKSEGNFVLGWQLTQTWVTLFQAVGVAEKCVRQKQAQEKEAVFVSSILPNRQWKNLAFGAL